MVCPAYFRHVQRKNSRYIGQSMLNMELAGRKKTARPHRSFIDLYYKTCKGLV